MHDGMDPFIDDFIATCKQERAGFLAGLSAAKLIVQNCRDDLDIPEIICELSDQQQFFEQLYWNRPERN